MPTETTPIESIRQMLRSLFRGAVSGIDVSLIGDAVVSQHLDSLCHYRQIAV